MRFLFSVFILSIFAWLRQLQPPVHGHHAIHPSIVITCNLSMYVSCGTAMLGAGKTTVMAEITLIQVFPPRLEDEIFFLRPKQDHPVSWPCVGTARDVPSTPWSPQRRDLLLSLNTYLSTYEPCRYQEGPLPTRVLDVGSATYC
ncbi:hypothetical protein B0T18DRAFT_432533 [Schizothecium vesticola]|uniref:Uncharacterized protein n=1 Tax=Schizothecium vesticola TaxID=314040 RepID=A0AA40ELD9_9PEZI|nr:hypothetical protein B0T18DRAFT_432533 [Schizothecium vesticola]